MAQQAPKRVAFLTDRDKPLVLAGPPRAVRGEFRLLNTTDDKVIIRTPLMRAKRPARAKAAAAATLPEAVPLRRIVVRGGQIRVVPLTLNLEPTTPPGTYHAEIDVDGHLQEVVVHVTEDVSFSIEPSTIVIPNRPGEKVQKQIVVTNTGNVALSMKSIGAVVLDDELAHCKALRGALHDVGSTMTTLDDFVTALGRRYHDLFETLALKVHNDKTTVAPGDTQAVELTMTLPEKLNARTRYTGYAAISTQSLSFVVAPE
jgi:hypothetical protein